MDVKRTSVEGLFHENDIHNNTLIFLIISENFQVQKYFEIRKIDFHSKFLKLFSSPKFIYYTAYYITFRARYTIYVGTYPIRAQEIIQTFL